MRFYCMLCQSRTEGTLSMGGSCDQIKNNNHNDNDSSLVLKKPPSKWNNARCKGFFHLLCCTTPSCTKYDSPHKIVSIAMILCITVTSDSHLVNYLWPRHLILLQYQDYKTKKWILTKKEKKDETSETFSVSINMVVATLKRGSNYFLMFLYLPGIWNFILSNSIKQHCLQQRHYHNLLLCVVSFRFL